jgi:hypothetical protein
MGRDIQKTDPRLDALMVEVGKKIGEAIKSTEPYAVSLGLKGRIVTTTRSASLGESMEIMSVTILKYTPSASEEN